jgi:adenylate cyclase
MSAALTVDAIRDCFDSTVPAIMATADMDGTPNVTYLSQVQFVDHEHIALSYQFFNKTRQNILANPHAQLMILNPKAATTYRLSIQYLRTETSGPLFERMKAKLAGIASHTGMSGVFRLLGSDIFHVADIQLVANSAMPPQPPRPSTLAALRVASERLLTCSDLEQILVEVPACLDEQFNIHYSMMLMFDAPNQRLYTVASRGYEESGVGSEIPLGQGVIGVAARERTPIRIGHMNAEYAYSRTIRENLQKSGAGDVLELEIPMPGLCESRSQIAVPIVACGRLIGVLFAESPVDLRFTYDDEDALVALAAQIGMTMHILQNAAEMNAAEASDGPPPAEAGAIATQGAALVVRHYAENDSVFLDDDYLIKGVAGSILWTVLRDYVDKQRTAFTNRELRLDARIGLPDISDNLEARLILLGRRLTERNAGIQIEKSGRGRFRLCVDRPIKLIELPA